MNGVKGDREVVHDKPTRLKINTHNNLDAAEYAKVVVKCAAIFIPIMTLSSG